MTSNPRYSICMCNYNMADTLDVSLRSILDQLDERYELVLVDDGSSDNSLEIIKSLQNEYSALRFIVLPRDSKRKLGETRNISIREARGEYVLLHLDCDDVWEPHIDDFIKAFHQVEAAAKRDLYVSGQHINIGKKDFLLSQGGFANIYRGEDRLLWARMAEIGAYIPLDHAYFYKRLPKQKKQTILRSLYHTWDHLVNEFRAGAEIKKFFTADASNMSKFSWKTVLLRWALVFPAKIVSLFYPSLGDYKTLENAKKYIAYSQRMRGTLKQVLEHFGAEPDYSVFSDRGRTIFETAEK